MINRQDFTGFVFIHTNELFFGKLRISPRTEDGLLGKLSEVLKAWHSERIFNARSSGHSPLERMNRGSLKARQGSLDKELN